MGVVGMLFDIFTEAMVFLLVVSIVAVVLAPILFALLAYRRTHQARLWDRTVLTLRANSGTSPSQRELAHLRLQLVKAVRSAKGAVAALSAAGGPRGELPALVQRLERTSALLEAQLTMMQSEIDEAALAEFLPPARARVGELLGVVRHVRQAALLVMGGEMEDDLHRLTADVDREVEALRSGVDALRALTVGELAEEDVRAATGSAESGLTRRDVR